MDTKIKQLLEIIHFSEDKLDFNIQYDMDSIGEETIIDKDVKTDSSYIQYYNCRRRNDYSEHWLCYDLYVYKNMTKELLTRISQKMDIDASYQKFKDADTEKNSTFCYLKCEDNIRIDFTKKLQRLKDPQEICSIQIVKFDSV